MPSQFEVFIECPSTGKLVSTGYVVAKPAFGDDEKPYGSFNCSVCNNAHVWNYKESQILEVHR